MEYSYIKKTMSKKRNCLLFCISLIFFNLRFLKAQDVGQTSIYSYYGMGQALDTQTIASHQMGGTGAVNTDLRQFSLSNPALLSSITMTSYTFGAYASHLTQRIADLKQTSAAFIPSYLAMAFPFGKFAGVGLGVRQSNKVAYEFNRGDQEKDGLYNYQGFGGINDLFIATGVRIFKNFSLGVEVAYRFGTMEHLSTFKRQGVQLDARTRKTIIARGFQFKYALSNHFTLSEKKGIALVSSAVLKHSMPLRLSQKNLFYKGIFPGPESEGVAEESDAVNYSGTYKLPIRTTLGVALIKPLHWNIGAMYRFANARQITGANIWSYDQTDFSYSKSSRFGVGGYYIPDYQSLTNYFKTVTYRFGGFYERIGKRVKGSELTVYGASLGLGVAVGQRRLAHFDFGVSYQQLQGNNKDLIKEQRIMFTCAISFAGRWFLKRKIQ